MTTNANNLFQTTLCLLERCNGINVLSASPNILYDGDYGISVKVNEEVLEFWLRIVNIFIQSNPDSSKMAIEFKEERQNIPLERHRVFFVRFMFSNSHASDVTQLNFFKNFVEKIRSSLLMPELCDEMA